MKWKDFKEQFQDVLDDMKVFIRCFISAWKETIKYHKGLEKYIDTVYQENIFIKNE